MENNFYNSLKKFMKTLGITYTIEMAREYRNTYGEKNVCFEIRVEHKGTVQYLQHHCYGKVRDEIRYTGGNEIMGVKDGVLAYLGDNQKVDEYFDGLARIKARDYLDSDF